MRALARTAAICLMALAVAGCATTSTGERKVDLVKACNVTTLASLAVQDVANVLTSRGVAPTRALQIASAAQSTQAAADIVCPILITMAPLSAAEAKK